MATSGNPLTIKKRSAKNSELM
uniref:PDR5 n=1 Tax=Arundo donax TaxID=35708 RepID=A0A0A9C7B4_ARUDO